MEWEEPHDSTLYCLQTDGNHLLATGSSYYGVVRLWDRRQRACLHVSVLPTAGLLDAGTCYWGLCWERVCLEGVGGSLQWPLSPGIGPGNPGFGLPQLPVGTLSPLLSLPCRPSL